MAKPETITSAANPLLKDVRRAISRGGLTAQGWCVAETFHLLEEALRSDCEVKAVLAAETARAAVEAYVRRLAGVKVVVLPDALFPGSPRTETSQGVIALVQPPRVDAGATASAAAALVVVLDGLQDPGNAGTIVRAAEAFGATGVLFLKGTVSPFNPKTLRASAGSLFRVPFLHGVDRATGARRAAAAPGRRSSPPCRGPRRRRDSLAAESISPARCALIIGSEAHGVSAELRAAAAAMSPFPRWAWNR